jgi:glutamine synthetase
MTPKEVLDMAKENGAKIVDLRFMDFPGLWQHFSVPIGSWKNPVLKTASVLTDRVFAAGSRFMPATCWSYRTLKPPKWTLSMRRRP